MKHSKDIKLNEGTYRVSIAITGGIGSGKSTVSEELKKLGYPVFSCDEIYRNLSFEKNYLKELQKIFPEAVNENLCLNRKILADIVFNDSVALKKLNDLAHPIIMRILDERISKETGLVFSEVPLLFEGGFEERFDCIIIVLREEKERIRYICERDKIDTKEAIARISSQYDYNCFFKEQKKQEKNKFIIYNNGSKEDLKIAVLNFITEIEKVKHFS